MEIYGPDAELKTFGPSKVTRTQSTFLEFACYTENGDLDDSKTFRIDYRGKKEFSVRPGNYYRINILDVHPLLLAYREPNYRIDLLGPILDKEAFLSEIYTTSARIFDLWRDASDFSYMPLEEFVTGNFGIMMVAPKSYAEAVVQVAERLSVPITTQILNIPAQPFPKLVLLDRRYVIADDFVVRAT